LNGQDTALELTGGIDVGEERVDVEARGDASLAILQLFFSDLSTSGAANLRARILGQVDEPSIFGQATITDGRLRHRGFAHSLTNVNGPIVFDTTGVNLNRLTGQMGEGDVNFGGTIALRGFEVQQFAVTATGQSMRLRYPEGLRSTVNANLELRGTPEAPLLTGRVDVLQATYQVQLDGDLLSLAGGGVAPAAEPLAAAGPSGFPLAFDVRILSESTPVIELPTATLWASADLRFSGTVDRPSLTGRISVDQGEAFILGNRYLAQGGYIDFRNPTRIEPVFDIQVETRVRVPGQTYRITVQITGPIDSWVPTFTSDPSVGSDSDVLSLLLGELPELGSLEQRAIRTPQAAQQQMLRTGVAQLMASPISSAVGSVFERVAPIDTVQITPLLGNEGTIQQLNPTARITFGTRIGPRAFLTYSRAFNPAQFEVILLEVDQSDRLSWIISRNEDRTFALDFRIRYVF
jgi:translocation and assembly module TamB